MPRPPKNKTLDSEAVQANSNPTAAGEIISDLAASSAMPPESEPKREYKSPPNPRIDSDFKVGVHLSRNAPKYRYEIHFDENPKTSLSERTFAVIEAALKTPQQLQNGHATRFSWDKDDKCWFIRYHDDSRAQCQQMAKVAFREISNAIREFKGFEPSLIR